VSRPITPVAPAPTITPAAIRPACRKPSRSTDWGPPRELHMAGNPPPHRRAQLG
jgi:hypothetical protein